MPVSRGEGGFTLVELMVAITIGLATTASAVSLLTSATRRSDEAQRRSEATQRAQVALDTITKDLRSQVCLRPANVTPLAPVAAASATSVSFFVDFSRSASTDAGSTPERRTLTLDSSGTLREQIWTTVNATGAGVGTAQTRVLGTDLAGGFAGNAVFQYYGFNTTTGAADTALSAPLDATALATVARISVSIKGQPRGTKDGTRETPLVDDVFVRLVDPDAGPVPTCA